MRVFCVCMVSWTLYGPPSHGLYPRGLCFFHKVSLSLSVEGLSPEDHLIHFRILSTDMWFAFWHKPWLVLVHYLSHPWMSFSTLGWVLPPLPTTPFPAALWPYRHLLSDPPLLYVLFGLPAFISLPSSPASPPWPLPFSMTLDDTVTVAQNFQAALALQTREHGSSCSVGPSGAFMILLPVTHTFLVFLLLGLLDTLWTYHAPQDLWSFFIPAMPSPARHACFSVKVPTIHWRPTGNVSLSMKPWPIFPSRSDPPSLPLSGPTRTLFVPSAGHHACCWDTR